MMLEPRQTEGTDPATLQRCPRSVADAGDARRDVWLKQVRFFPGQQLIVWRIILLLMGNN